MPHPTPMTREEEAACASRIAAGDAAVFAAIAGSTHALEEVLAIGDRVASDDLFEREVSIADREYDSLEKPEQWAPTMRAIRSSVAKGKPVTVDLLAALKLNAFAIREVVAGLAGRIEERIVNDLEAAALRRSMAGIVDGLAVAAKARNELVSRNLRLVQSLARRHNKASSPIDDIVQDGNLGLMRAAEMFDPAKNVKFATYATYHIRQSIGRGFDDHGRTIRIPVGTRERYRMVMATRRKLQQLSSSEPTDERVSQECGLSVDAIREVGAAHRGMRSLDAETFEDGNLHEVVPSDSDPIDAVISRKRARAMVESVLSSLPKRDATVLRLRYGIDGREGTEEMTLEKIGAMHSLTRERIRQLEVKAIAKVREPKTLAVMKAAARDFGFDERVVER